MQKACAEYDRKWQKNEMETDRQTDRWPVK